MKQRLFSVIFFFIFAFSVFGQTQDEQRPCHLEINVYEQIEQKTANGSVFYPTTKNNILLQTTATAINAKTNYKMNQVSLGSNPLFLRVGNGEFLVTVQKEGYKTAISRVFVNCNQVDLYNKFLQIVFLSKGKDDENQILKPPREGIATRIGNNFTLENVPISERRIKFIDFPAPSLPLAAKALHLSGSVILEVVIDELGFVASVSNVSGNPLLANTAMKAVLDAEFLPMKLSGKWVKTYGKITFDFTQ